ncbi:uncharacterized protein BYT42DRAFT_579303 [Radiomyces spectabilis]|uniref:uncharacterized protein n=1 Tax=Radiomyces spectabilis TaxID=64574 RepID=UPI0022211923|nr:uncharacterized protein BYT42DRAFT_579303 [Radiomyces spectabilis]KAI8373137.1 hypothetical protein BYT42DRAFT_579303 [Radiomyces spectabilis]
MTLCVQSAPGSPDEWSPRSKANSTSSRAHSSTSASSRSFSAAGYDAIARTYYHELRTYLASFLAKEAAEGPHPQRVAARQKLARLHNHQFHELAMDVYDELMRRKMDDKQVPFLAVREEFHPKRNQARQKLATLPVFRFKDLASDVFYALTRRYPQITDAEDHEWQPLPPLPTSSVSSPQPQRSPPAPPAMNTSQATNIVPAKGTFNLEPVDVSGSDDETMSDNSPLGNYITQRKNSAIGNESSRTSYSAKLPPMPRPSVSSPTTAKEGDDTLDSLMADLGNMVAQHPSPSKPEKSSYTDMHKAPQRIEAGTDGAWADYEHRIAVLTRRVHELETEVAPSNQSQSTIRPTELDRLKKIEEEYHRLQNENRGHQRLMREVKDETSELLKELKVLASENDELRAEKERADARIRYLAEEARKWEDKYEKARLELRNLKASSTYGAPKCDLSQTGFIQPTKEGVIQHAHIIAYQAAIDELLQVARSSVSGKVLLVVQNVIPICKSMTEETEAFEAKADVPLTIQTELPELKTRFTNALKQLISATELHARSMGLSPVCLLDAAASHLTAAVVDLVKLVGMAPSTDEEEKQEVQNDAKKTESTEKNVDEPAKTSTEPVARKNGILPPDELVAYLRSETGKVVQNIQGLLAALRSTHGPNNEAYSIISKIIHSVMNVNTKAQDTFNSSLGMTYRTQGDLILMDLQASSEKLLRLRDTSFVKPDTASSTAKRDLAKEAYEVAKYIKELIHIFK